MPFRLSPDDASLRAALVRLTTEELGTALDRLDRADASGVHDVRKRVKKVRGLIRLLRAGFADFDAVNAELRNAAQSLSAARDAEVRLSTFDGLWPDGHPPELQDIRETLLAARTDGGAVDVSAARDGLASVLGRVPDWHVQGRDREVLAEGLARARRGAVRAMKKASHTKDVEAMHDWRKRAKDYWYQARLLMPVWPEAMQPLVTAAETLTEDLGRHHDLAVLAAHVGADSTVSPNGQGLLALRITGEAAAIEAQCFPLGRRLFAGDPDAMAKVWVDWWRLWRDQADG